MAIVLTVVGPALLLIALLSCWPRLSDRRRLFAIVLLTAVLDAAITVSVTWPLPLSAGTDVRFAPGNRVHSNSQNPG